MLALDKKDVEQNPTSSATMSWVCVDWYSSFCISVAVCLSALGGQF